MPEHLRQNTRRGWGWLPYAAIGLLGALWLFTLVADDDVFGRLWGPQETADAESTGLPPAALAAAGAADGAATVPADANLPKDAAAGLVAAADPVDEAEAARLAGVLPVDPRPGSRRGSRERSRPSPSPRRTRR